MNELILRVLGSSDIDIKEVRNCGFRLITDRYGLNSEQATLVESTAFKESGGDLLKYVSRLTDLGEFISLMMYCG